MRCIDLVFALAIFGCIAKSGYCRGVGGFRGGGGGWKSTGSSSRYTPSAPSRPRSPPPHSTTNKNYGFQVPRKSNSESAPKLPSSPGGTSGGEGGTKSSNFGWQVPKSTSHNQNKNDWVGQPRTTTSMPYGWKKPTPRPQTEMYTTRPITPHPYPKQAVANQQPLAGKKYEKGFSKGYDSGYRRGLQQGAKTHIPPAYYPPQNQFGYPGGVSAGYGHPSYGGMNLFGSSGNYGYPVNSAYNYNTYGTGSGSLAKGLVVGAVGGYLLNSAIHSFSYSNLHSSPSWGSNHWGYSGSGYGSDYRYTKVDNSVVNNYYFNQSSSKDEDRKKGWIQCVAYDPMSDTTLINPNCTCNVTIEPGGEPNVTVAVHHCNSASGYHVEKSEIEIFDENEASVKKSNPEKIQQENLEERRNEIFKQLEKIVNMGSFTSAL